jgi:hypothetical protein
MDKNTKEKSRIPKATESDHPIIPTKYQHLAAMAVIYICLLIFFHSIIFGGKTYESADTIAAHSWDTLYKDAQAQNIFPLWNPYIFCGMPGFASLTFSFPRVFDLTIYIWNNILAVLQYLFLGFQSNWVLLYYLIYGIGVYLFVFQQLKNKPIALIVSLMATYATYIALLIMMGHITKIIVLAFFPYVFLIVEKIRQKFDLFQAILLVIVIHLMIDAPHIQFIFYIYLSLGLYFIFFLIRSLIKKENWKGLIVSGSTLLFATVIAFLMGADKYISILEYNPYSMRGANPIQETSASIQNKTIEGGLDYDYATSWSFSPGEIMTFFVPSWYGFGNLTYQGPLTQNHPQRLNFYWGPQQFVDGPQYMGVVVIILAIIGFYRNRKNPFIQYMGLIIVFSLLVAFGREFPLIYDLMYRYFPMFNKFRIPLMILMLVQFFTPILAGYGIASFVSERPKTIGPVQNKKWKYALGVLILGIFISLIGKNLIKDIYSSFFPLQEIGKTLARSYGQLNPTVLTMIFDFIFSSVMTDLLVGFVLLTLTFGAFYYYQKGKLKPATLYGLLVIIVLFDLWRIAWKPSDPKNRQETFQEMTQPDYVNILQQDSTNYRVLKMINGQPVYDNSLAKWRLQNAYGYHGAKMRIYQDMVDVAGLGNPLVWQLMNIKYLITNKEESNPALMEVYNTPDTKMYQFRHWMPRIFFVNKYEVTNNLDILNKIAAISFNPRDVAYMSEKIQEQIDPPSEKAQAVITHYDLQDMEIQATATGNNLLFLSETYYPKGWKALIDGKETEILRLDYLFRGVIIPPGTHILSMKFEPSSFVLGKNVTLISNIIIILGVLLQGTLYYIKKKKDTKITAQ